MSADSKADGLSISRLLTRLQVGKCTCMTMTPEIKWHDANCTYRLAVELENAIAAHEAQRGKVEPRLLQDETQTYDSRGLTRWFQSKPDARQRVREACAAIEAEKAPIVQGALPHDVLRALRFYANGEHLMLDPEADFESVSGEPQNWLASGREGDSTMVEDGSVARHTLQGVAMHWEPEDEPEAISGEVLSATPQPPAIPEVCKPLTLDYESLLEDASYWSRHVVEDTSYQTLEEHLIEVFAKHGIAAAPKGQP